MTTEGLPYEEALRQAQQLGYAEADPTLDVDGTDTAHKLAILAQLAFEANVRLDEIPRQGIDRLQGADLKYAGELGYAIKLLALARLSTGRAGAARGARRSSATARPLAEVRGPYNAIRVVGDAVGDTLFYGRGAGAMPTASAVVGDLIEVATGRAGLPSRLRDLWSDDAPAVPIARPPSTSAAATISASRSPTGPASWAGSPRSSATRGSASPASSSTTPATTPPSRAPSRW